MQNEVIDATCTECAICHNEADVRMSVLFTPVSERGRTKLDEVGKSTGGQLVQGLCLECIDRGAFALDALRNDPAPIQ